ncbi:uncharacterized protein JCM6883_004503 [Sporobolomyces salmoneus]|uniref:uncharacterized protein n=1 Tax=Sporobolomyces salmoneus TaxID=183962 RepID=UPI00316B1EBB
MLVSPSPAGCSDVSPRSKASRNTQLNENEMLNKDPFFRDFVPFHEFFHADSGKGLGASHQTGWTGLVAYFIWSVGSTARLPRTPRTPRSAASWYFGENIPSTPGATSEAENSDAWGYQSTGELSPDEL